ncbi:MAG: hypothetical protein CMB31_01860, partial [Euryarchaeota archaeon]|nr:hypothetical protein [Euryarchaeota archaeon]
MPPTEKEKMIILNLRGNGLTYAQISEETGVAPSTVAKVCKDRSAKFHDSLNVKFLYVKQFLPKATIVVIDCAKFEELRENTLLYAHFKGDTWTIFEIRSHGIIHQTTLPRLFHPCVYPYLAKNFAKWAIGNDGRTRNVDYSISTIFSNITHTTPQNTKKEFEVLQKSIKGLSVELSTILRGDSKNLIRQNIHRNRMHTGRSIASTEENNLDSFISEFSYAD